jgi:ABC-type nickel/cobalt efflux system permease component RcnA
MVCWSKLASTMLVKPCGKVYPTSVPPVAQELDATNQVKVSTHVSGPNSNLISHLLSDILFCLQLTHFGCVFIFWQDGTCLEPQSDTGREAYPLSTTDQPENCHEGDVAVDTTAILIDHDGDGCVDEVDPPVFFDYALYLCLCGRGRVYTTTTQMCLCAQQNFEKSNHITTRVSPRSLLYRLSSEIHPMTSIDPVLIDDTHTHAHTHTSTHTHTHTHTRRRRGGGRFSLF